MVDDYAPVEWCADKMNRGGVILAFASHHFDDSANTRNWYGVASLPAERKSYTMSWQNIMLVLRHILLVEHKSWWERKKFHLCHLHHTIKFGCWLPDANVPTLGLSHWCSSSGLINQLHWCLACEHVSNFVWKARHTHRIVISMLLNLSLRGRTLSILLLIRNPF